MKLALAVVLLPLALLVSLMSTPAQAVGAVITVANGVLYECDDHPYNYSLDLPPGTDSFTLEARATGPDGLVADSDFVFDGPRIGAGSFFLCGFDLPGTYMITGEVRAYDVNYNKSTYALPLTTFVMRQPLTRTGLSAKKDVRPGQEVNFRVTTLEERPTGYFANEYAAVYLEQKFSGRWKRIKKAKTTTDSSGRGKISVKYTGGRLVVRAVHPGSLDEPGSTSRQIVVR